MPYPVSKPIFQTLQCSQAANKANQTTTPHPPVPQPSPSSPAEGLGVPCRRNHEKSGDSQLSSSNLCDYCFSMRFRQDHCIHPNPSNWLQNATGCFPEYPCKACAPNNVALPLGDHAPNTFTLASVMCLPPLTPHIKCIEATLFQTQVTDSQDCMEATKPCRAAKQPTKSSSPPLGMCT